MCCHASVSVIKFDVDLHPKTQIESLGFFLGANLRSKFQFDIAFVFSIVFDILMRNWFPDSPSLFRFSDAVISVLEKTRKRRKKRQITWEPSFLLSWWKLWQGFLWWWWWGTMMMKVGQLELLRLGSDCAQGSYCSSSLQISSW